jgi:hypothetical protein
MLEALLPQILQAINQVASRIHKLLIVVLPVSFNQAIDTKALSEVTRLLA